MSVQSARAFIERVKADAEFRAALAGEPGKAARMAYAEKAGFSFTMEELESLRAEYSDDDLGEVLFQERPGGYDSPLGHGILRPVNQ